MTYGWAILIIAVVLAALDLLGVFNGSAFIGTSCLSTPGYSCTNPIMTANSTGPNLLSFNFEQDTGITIYNVSFICAASSTSLGYPNVNASNFGAQTSSNLTALSSESSVYVSGLNCYSSNGNLFKNNPIGTAFSGTLWIRYNTQGFPPSNYQYAKIAKVTAKVTSTTPISSLQSLASPLYSVPITLTNSQSSATPAPFQQMVNITESSFSSYLTYNSNFANFEYFYSNGTIIPSWIEANDSGKLITWLKLNKGISASSTAVVYLGFAAANNLLSSSGTTGIGEAPQLSSTYAEYDDGANLFQQYGGGGSVGWSQFTYVGGTWTTANGYLQQTATTSFSVYGGPAALIESANYITTGQYILGMAFNYTTQADARAGIVAVATPTTITANIFGYRFIGQQISNGAGFISFINPGISWVVDNIYQGAINTPYTMTITDAGGTWSGNLYSGYSEGSTPLTSLTPTSYSAANGQGQTTGYVGISAVYYNGINDLANPINVMWYYVRAYPPNGVMPLVTFGTVS